MPSAVDRVDHLERVAELVAAARREGIYECDPDWRPIDEALRELGFDPTPRA